MSKALELGLTYSVSKELGSKFVEEVIIEEDGGEGSTLHAGRCEDGVSCAHVVKELLETTADAVWLTIKYDDGTSKRRHLVI